VVAGARVTSARSEILQRIATALGDVPAAEPPRAGSSPSRATTAGDDDVALFAERVEDYRAIVSRCDRRDVALTVAEICERNGARAIVAPAGVPTDWVPTSIECVIDGPSLDVDALDQMHGVITGAAVAIAETGTIILDGGTACGRRAVSLLPDLHICVVREEDIVRDVPDGLSAVQNAVGAGRPITLISGPSATSDIELERVEGVHGPRRLEVLLVAS
jgi:L-lactate dehydrogenase complex protein LldG